MHTRFLENRGVDMDTTFFETGGVDMDVDTTISKIVAWTWTWSRSFSRIVAWTWTWSRTFSKIVARTWTWTRRETGVHLTLIRMMQTPIAHLKASIHAFNFDSGSFTSLKRTHKGPTCSYILTMLQKQVHNFVNPRLRKGVV